MDRQGGRRFGEAMGQFEETLKEMNKEYLEDDAYDEVEDLEEKLESFTKKFLDFDLDIDGNIDFMGLKQMLEKLGQPKTHMEAKKMMTQVAVTNSETITYRDFVEMMLGRRSSVLRLILLFEDKTKEKDSPTGPPAKRSLDSLP